MREKWASYIVTPNIKQYMNINGNNEWRITLRLIYYMIINYLKDIYNGNNQWGNLIPEALIAENPSCTNPCPYNQNG